MSSYEDENKERTENSGFTDASYIPHDEAPKVPRSYSYDDADSRRPPKRERRGMGAGAVIALCLVCLIIGAAVGVFGMSTGRSTAPAAEAPAPVPTEAAEAEAETVKTAPEQAQKAPESEAAAAEAPAPVQTETPVLSTAEAAESKSLDATDIYDLACRQVVGISTEVTYQSYYGVQTGTVTGSGFIISEDGYILTNYHVAEYAAEGGYPITVVLYNGDTYEAKIVGFENDGSDIAVLKIDASGLDAAVLGDSKNIRVGETVYAVGNPLGELDYTMTSGIVSAMDREITTTRNGTSSTVNMFQISAAVNSGNSGGPVYNSAGEIIGVVTAKYSDSIEEMGIEGLGFAIPIDDAKNIATDLIENGYVRGKAYMGIYTKSVSSAAARAYYDMVEGAYVYDISSGSCAEAAGLQTGDIITGVGDYAVASVSDLQAALKNYKAGESAVLSVFRDGETIEIRITFDEKQPNSGAQQAQPGYGHGTLPGYGGNGGFNG